MNPLRWLAATVMIILVTYSPQLGSPLELQDDHRIIASLLSAQPDGLRLWADSIRDDVLQVGRFRPVNQIFDVVGPIVFGPSALVWHCVLLALVVTVAVLLFYVGWKLWGSPAAATVFALVTLLAPDPGPTAAWYRLGPKESWGVLFLAIALALMVLWHGRCESLTIVFVVLAAYSKESFVLVLPALFGVRLWLETRDNQVSLASGLRRLRIVAIVYALVFAFGLAAIAISVHSAGAHSYGARSLTLPVADIVWVMVRDSARAPSLAVWFVAPALAIWLLRGRRERSDLFAAALFITWIVPQYVLYGTRGGFWDHYWIPCVIAFAAVNAVAVSSLVASRGLYRVAMVVFAIWTANAMRIDFCAVRNFKARSRVQQEAVRAAADGVTPRSVLLIVANLETQSEIAQSFADFVRARGGRYGRALLWDSGSTSAPSIPAKDVSVVVHLDTRRPPAISHWLGADFQPVSVTRPQVYFSLRRLGTVVNPFSISIDVRRP